jgi:hypothetical protein
MAKFNPILGATVVYLILYVATYVVHVRFFEVNVVFYAAILDGFIAALIGAAGLFSLKYFDVLTHSERMLLLVVWVLVGYSGAISVPTVIDRSLSFYLLEKIQQRGGGIEKNAFHEVFVKEYVTEHRLVDIRLTEQLESGTIEIANGCVKLTPRGERLATFSRFFRRNLLPSRRLIMGQYSDDLTDPFRHSVAASNYACH